MSSIHSYSSSSSSLRCTKTSLSRQFVKFCTGSFVLSPATADGRRTNDGCLEELMKSGAGTDRASLSKHLTLAALERNPPSLYAQRSACRASFFFFSHNTAAPILSHFLSFSASLCLFLILSVSPCILLSVMSALCVQRSRQGS